MNIDNYPRILIVSDATWADDNNIGNTFSNLFLGWPKDKIAMIYARPSLPDTIVCNNFFQISETRLIKNLINKNIKTGMTLNTSKANSSIKHNKKTQKDEQAGKKLYNFFLKYRWNIFLSARETLWGISNWKTDDLNKFIDDFNPELVLSLADSSVYMNSLQQYVMMRSKAKSIIYFVDDVYSNKRFNLSPIFWFNRQITRKGLRKTVSMCDSVYTIIDKQKQEYDSFFNVRSKILNKGGDFSDSTKSENDKCEPIKLVYTGNITSGRWQTLVKIGEALDKINKNHTKAILSIYTKNQLYGKIDKAFQEIKSIEFKGSIDANQVKEVQNRGDILVHVESMKLKEKLETRLSFSTKLVDYFERGKCILAVGWSEAASIEYLSKNDLAVIIDDLNEIENIIKNILSDMTVMNTYGAKVRQFGKKNHQIDEIQRNFYFELSSLVKED